MLKKPSLSENIHARIVIDNFKPTARDGDKFFVIFVAPSGAEFKLRAVPRVWEMVRGRSAPGNKHTGFDLRDRNIFVGLTRIIEGVEQLVAVHCIPRHDHYPNSKPADLVGVSDISMRVSQATGEIDVRSMPSEMRQPQVMALLTAVDKLTELSPGMQLLESINAEVASVVNDDVRISVVLQDATAPTTLGAMAA